jgi:hypothetical protein
MLRPERVRVPQAAAEPQSSIRFGGRAPGRTQARFCPLHRIAPRVDRTWSKFSERWPTATRSLRCKRFGARRENRPPSVPQPGHRASNVHRECRVYTSCCFHHIGAQYRAIAMAVLQLIGVFCSPPFNRTQRRFLGAGCAFDDLTDFVVRHVPAIQDYVRQGRNGPIKWRTKYPFGSKCQPNH